jgi:flavin-dependent dehydrogenase
VSVPSEWFAGGVESAALGLSRAEMDARLLARARAVGVTVWEEARVSGLVRGRGGRVCGVRLSAGGAESEIESAVTIDATGRARALARLAGKSGREAAGATGGRADGGGDSLRPRGRERPRLVAFKAHLEGARGAAGACEIYFYRGGYGGLNSVEGGRSNLCFIAAAGDVRARESDPERVLGEVLMRNRRAAETLDGARAVSGWLAVSLEGFGRFAVAPAAGLLAVGDAASFIDPFTGSGMLMALQSGELAASIVAPRLARLRRAGGADDAGLATLADEYRSRYGARFGARLRICAALRRAAFAPRWATESGVFALGASAGLRRALARATRRGGGDLEAEI